MFKILAFIVRYLINPAAETAKIDAHDRKTELRASAILSGSLSDEKTADLEEALLREPENMEIRAVLLGKYDSARYFDNVAHQKRMKHIEWIVSSCPEHVLAGDPCVGIIRWDHEDDYQHIKSMWLTQVESKKNNPSVLMNAANFFDSEDKELAEKLLLDALALQPKNRDYRAKLASLYSYWDGHEEQAWRQAELLSKGFKVLDIDELVELPDRAFAAKKYDRAVSSAKWILFLIRCSDILKQHGGARNMAHTVIGKVALIKGDVSKAKYHLEQSIKDIACPTMQSFGPSLELADELLKVGEKAAVLGYLDKREELCGAFDRDAFLLRYEATEGITVERCRAFFDPKIEWAFYDRAYLALLKSDPLAKKVHLIHQISSVKSRLKDARRALERIESDKTVVDAEKREACNLQIDRCKAHLAKLDALLNECS